MKFLFYRQLLLTDRDFAIVFRTFGVDSRHVTEEMRMLIDGFHPQFTDPRSGGLGLEPSIFARLKMDTTRAVFNRSAKYTSLVWCRDGAVHSDGEAEGAWRHMNECHKSNTHLEETHMLSDAFQVPPGDVVVSSTALKQATDQKEAHVLAFNEQDARGCYADINDSMVQQLFVKSTNTYARVRPVLLIRDHYDYWFRCREAPYAGKLLIVPTREQVVICDVFGKLLVCDVLSSDRFVTGLYNYADHRWSIII